jgi:hypothetical protein
MTGPDDTNGGPPGGRRDPLDQIRHMIGVPVEDDFADIPTPTFWPNLPAADATAEWEQLRAWVEDLCGRFAHLDHHVVPRCWWRHNGHVEALAALRDHERSSYSDTAPATAPLEWLRALRDVAALLRAWTAELGCATTHHNPLASLRAVDEGEWERHVQADVERRHQQQIDKAAR